MSNAEATKPDTTLDRQDREGDKAGFGSLSDTEQYLKAIEPAFTRACGERDRCEHTHFPEYV